MALRLLVTAFLWALWQDPAASAATSEPKYLITLCVSLLERIGDQLTRQLSGESWTSTSFKIAEEKPSAANPIGNPPYPGHTSSSGPNWVSTLTGEVNTSLTLTYNFAAGGATIDTRIVAPHKPRQKSFSDQVDRFLINLGAKPDFAPWKASNTLVGVWIGMTDVGIHCECSPYGAICDNGVKIYSKSVKRYFELLDLLYYAGIRKFLLMTPPRKPPRLVELSSVTENPRIETDTLGTAVEMTPKATKASPGKRNIYLAHMRYYRGVLNAGYQKFKASHPDIKVRLIDPYPPFAEAYNNPQKYGAPNNSCEHTDGVSCVGLV